MDINAILVASLISGIANPLVNDIAAATNSRIEVKNIMYEGENITFQHSLWKIRNDTVCSSYTTISPDYSSCTVKAKMLFDDLCQYLSVNHTASPYHHSYQQMYCDAAVRFTPTIVSITKGDENTQSDSERLRIKCNSLTIDALLSKDVALIAERDRVCGLLRQ